MLERRDESRRIGPIQTGNVSAPIIGSYEDQAMWMTIRRMFADYNDTWFVHKFGVWITLE
jgi:hypothetical protein